MVAGDLRFTYTGAELFPSVEQLNEGKAISSGLQVTITAAGPAGAQALQKVLAPGATDIEAQVGIAVTGLGSGQELTVPAGKFAVGAAVHVAVTSVEILDLKSSYRDGLATVLKSGLITSTYYARGVGIVEQVQSGTKVVLESCSGGGAEAEERPLPPLTSRAVRLACVSRARTLGATGVQIGTLTAT